MEYTMTPNEFKWIKRAVETLDSGKTTDQQKLKILKTMSQICDRSAKNLEDKLKNID
jgi:hypothetical protein